MHPVPGQEAVPPFREAETSGPDGENVFTPEISRHQPVGLPRGQSDVGTLV